MTTSKRALLLDLDGTLADSLPVLYAIYGEFLAGFGKTATRAEFEKLNGVPMRKAVEALRETHALDASIDELFQTYQTALGTFYDRVQPTTGARELLAWASCSGWKTAIVTSSLRHHAQHWLGRVALGDVELVIGGDSVTYGKPNPEPYLMAAHRLQLSPQNCVAVEDSRLGLQAAVSAETAAYLLAPSATRAPDFDLSLYPGARGILERLDDLIPILDPIAESR